MTFVHGEALKDALEKILQGRRIWCAVAFWGKGAGYLLHPDSKKDIKIICNLKMGGTNPYVIEKLPATVLKKQLDTLHAKVYIGDSTALITSANASANGLGFEGKELMEWHEAGVVVEDIELIEDWFRSVWDQSKKITDDDLESAIAAWKRRRTSKPSLPSFLTFDSDADPMPLVVWYSNVRQHVNENLKHQSKLPFAEFNAVKQMIEGGIVIENDEDREILTPGTIILFWERNRNGTPSKKAGYSWCKLGNIIEDAMKVEGYRKLMPVAMRIESPNVFDVSEPAFDTAFRSTLALNKFQELRNDPYKKPWFTNSVVKLTKDFWRDVKSQYINTRVADERCGRNDRCLTGLAIGEGR